MPLAPLAGSALLLDLDGTLLDLAPTPGSVVVPGALLRVLQRLKDRLGGAMAIISGRPIAQIDALLPGLPFAVAGEHGGAFRHSPRSAVVRPDLPAVPPAWSTAAQGAVAVHPGTWLEVKARGLVFHYRAAPHAGPDLHRAALSIVAAGSGFEVMPAAMAWEVRPRGADKGTALNTIMGHFPFMGRTPLFIGDDVTDWDAIRAAGALGGTGLLVGTAFGTPAAVRGWLAAAVRGGEWPAMPEPWRARKVSNLQPPDP